MKLFLRRTGIFITILILSYLGTQSLPFFVDSYDPSCYHVPKVLKKGKKNRVAVYGDSKNYVNFNVDAFTDFFGDDIYNYAIWGGNIVDSDLMYGSDFLNAEQLNIINIHEVSFGREPEIFKRLNFLLAQITPFALSNRNPEEYYYKKGFMRLTGETYAGLEHINLGEGRGLEEANQDLFHHNAQLLLQHIKRKNAKVLFVIHPDRKGRTVHLDSLYGENYIGQIYQQYFSEYPLIDLRKYEQLHADTLYYDDHHMNAKGSTLLTDLFIEEYQKMMLVYPFLAKGQKEQVGMRE